MNTSLEQKRRLIEDLELIEYAITKRIKINPKIYKPENAKLNHHILKSNRYIPNSISILQKHEVNRLLEKYEMDRENLISLLVDDDTELSDINILKRPEFEHGDFTTFLNLCSSSSSSSTTKQEPEDSKPTALKDHEIYDLFSSSANYDELKQEITEFERPLNSLTATKPTFKKLKKRLETAEKFNYLSEFTRNLKLSSIFTPLEDFGNQLDLKLLFTMWLSLPRYKSISMDKIPKYKHYVKFINHRDADVKIEDVEYLKYLETLVTYLAGFYDRAYPLNGKDFKHDEMSRFKHVDNFCLVCNKQFSKDTVFNSHLTGKKHNNAIKKSGKVLELESKIASLLEFELFEKWENTINGLERVDLLTVRERELELRDRKPETFNEVAPVSLFFDRNLREQKNGGKEDGDGDEHEGDGDEEDDEFDEKLYNPLNLPIGPDGRPMPFWLYKIKGLTHEFKCEICDNETFRGRTNYNKHFKNVKHIEGLKRMGVIDDFKDFKYINTKKEVLELLDNIQRKNREDAQFADDVQQVEDDEGNAMSKKVYDQLKKQGLL